MKQNIDSLYDFINAAEKSRKYAPNSAAGLRSALRLFQKELNEEEKSSTSLFRQNFNQIYQQVVNKNISSYNASSLDVYRKRILRLLSDYEKYGIDPTKLSTWTPKVRMVIRDTTKLKKQPPIQKAMRYEVLTTRDQDYEIPFGSITLVIPNTEKAKTALLEGKFKDVAVKLTVLSKSLEDSA